MTKFNCYEDERRADSYAKLEFPGTYYLAYRDLAEIVLAHVKGRKAVDFGCGAGRSTRFLKRMGFDTIGIDISWEMVKRAKEMDIEGDYRVIEDGSVGKLENEAFDLVQSIFTFDNIPVTEKKVKIFRAMGNLLNQEGRIISMVSSPEIYFHEWASFSTRDFPGNLQAKSGDIVKIIQTDVEDKRPVEDIIFFDEDYQEVYKQAGLEIVQVYRPLGKEEEPIQWVNETRIAPWVIYILKKK